MKQTINKRKLRAFETASMSGHGGVALTKILIAGSTRRHTIAARTACSTRP